MSQGTTALPSIEPELTPRPIDPGARIGHVHLKVADLDRALAFYCGVLGFELKQRYGRGSSLRRSRRLSPSYRPQYLGKRGGTRHLGGRPASSISP